jgi:sporulation protein YlmC with PRC-barrel domain
MQPKTKAGSGDPSRRGRPSRLLALVAALATPLALAPAAGVAQSIDIDIAALHEIDDDRTDITHEGLTVDQLEDMDVVRNGEVIGEVEDVLGDENGEIVALVVEYGGNILGLGDREVVVPIEQFEIPPGRNEVEISLTDEELAALPVWDD